MLLKNLTTGKIICHNLKICTSFTDRMFGLLLHSNPRNLLLKTRFGIHTFFLKEPIDVLVLDDNLKVIQTKKNLKPNSLFFWPPTYSTVVELPKHSIDKYRIKLDNYLQIL